MIQFFKERSELKKEYYRKGFETGYQKANLIRKKDLQRLKKEAISRIKEKEEQIGSRDTFIRQLKEILAKDMHTFTEMEMYVSAHEKDKYLEWQKSAEEYAVAMKYSSKLASIKRVLEKRLPKLTNKIDQYMIEHFN